MKSSAASKSYAKALFALAKERNQTDAIGTDLENARLTYARTQNLSKEGVVSPQELDQARTANNGTSISADVSEP